MNFLGADDNFYYKLLLQGLGPSNTIAYPNIFRVLASDETASSVIEIQSVILSQQLGEPSYFGAYIQYLSRFNLQSER